VQYEQEWSPPSPVRHRSRSTYTAARSESPSIYSRRFDDSPRASFDDLSFSHPRPLSEATQRNDDPYGGQGETEEPVDEPSDTRLSLMGPTTRVYSRAPWEVGEDNVLREEDENYAETRSVRSVRSVRSGRSRSKKRAEKDSSSNPKSRKFAPSLANVAGRRSSSVPRPSTDTQGLSSSTSSNYSRPSFSTNLRPESSVSKSEYPWSARSVNGYHHQDRSPASSPRSMQNDRSSTDPETRRLHPYANPDNLPQSLAYHPHAQHEQVDEEYIMVSSSSPGLPGGLNQVAGSNHKQVYHPTHGTVSPRQYPVTSSRAGTPLGSPHDGLPPKMAPWQHTPSSPTFRLLSLEEAQAMKSKQRTVAMGTAGSTSSSPHIRGRTVSERLKSHTAPQETAEFEENSKSATPNLKTRRSLLGLFGKKERDRPVTPRAASPPPPVPSLPPSVPGTPSGFAPQLTSSTAPKSPRRIPPPSLNAVENSPLTENNNAKENTSLSPLPSPKHQPTTQLPPVPSPPPVVMAPQPRKKGSFLGHGSRAPLAKPPSINRNPGSTSPSIAFPALQVRPVSTIFSSLPSDYLSGAASPPVPVLSFRATADSPSTPGFSSRSASFSTGSSDAGPRTPSVDHSANAAVLSQLRDQVNGAREVWKSQISDLEAQVRSLKKEIEELKVAPCASCGHVACGDAPNEMKTSMLNRPRAKTAAGGRTLFGGDD